MAVRIRKLARELQRTPDELIGVLHALGFIRYRSPEDMLSDATIAKLKTGLRKGVEPVVVDTQRSRASSAAASAGAGKSQGDIMQQLVPGVVPQRARGASAPPRRPAATASAPARQASARAAAAPAATPAPAAIPAPAATPAPAASPARDVAPSTLQLDAAQAAIDSGRRALASERAVLAEERAAFESERATIDARAQTLAAEAHALADLRAALDAERAALQVEREAFQAGRARREARGELLLTLFEERGLLGLDECQRAFRALIAGRHLTEVWPLLRVDAPDVLRRVLDTRLALAAGEVPEAIASKLATVTVAPARAEMPDAREIAAASSRLGERLLLNGIRRVTLFGGRPLYQRVVKEGLDPRVAMATLPRWQEPGEPQPGGGVELFVFWDESVPDLARQLAVAGRVRLASVDGPSIAQFYASVLDSLGS